MVNNQRFEETFNKVNSEYSNYFEGNKGNVLSTPKVDATENKKLASGERLPRL